MNNKNQFATSDIRLKKIARCVGATLGVSMSVGMISPLWAQQAPAPAANATEEIVVSASRIARSGFTAPTPTTTVNAEDFEARATTTVSNMLYELPSIRPVNTPTSASQGLGQQAINLRTLGTNRTLILVDGRRFVGTSVAGVVDSNVLPNSLIERVEVVTGGASAAWGSDAVAGVVNFIFKKKIEGVQGNLQVGQSSRGDDKSISGSLSWGTSFANGRGQFMIAGEASKNTEPQKLNSRGWSNGHQAFVSGTINGSNVANILVNGATLQNLTFGGVIAGLATVTSGSTLALKGIQFGPGGTVQPFTYGTNPTGNYMVGGSGGWYIDEFSFLPSPKRKNVYARATYDFSNDLRGYVELSSLRADSEIAVFPVYTPNARTQNISIKNDNAYLPAAVKTIMTANNIASFNLGRIMPELGNDIFTTNNKTDRVVAGLDGEVFGDYKWKAYVTNGKTRIDSQIRNNLIVSNFIAAFDPVVDATGKIVCRASTVSAQFAAAGCVPGNPFGAGSITADVKNYVTGTQSNYYDIKLDAGGVQLQGEPFSTWAGKVSLAGGYEYRKESITGDSDPLSKTVNAANTLGSYQFGNPQPISGAYTVKEWFGETLIPLAANLPFAQTLDLNAAVRNTNYSISGKVSSNKVGLTYKPVESVMLRGTKSKDIRAPNLNELFQAGAISAFVVTDYGKLISGVPDAYTTVQTATGNTRLRPEIADTKTFGVALTPAFIPGLKLSIDSYSIELKDAIASVTAQQLVNGCVGVLGFAPTPAFCTQITRDPASGRISNAITSNINFQSYKTKGVDYELSYRMPAANLMAGASGNLTFRALATNLKSYIINNGISAIDRAGEIVGFGGGIAGGGSGIPKWRSTYSATYQSAAWTLFGQAKYIGKGVYDPTATPAIIDNNEIPSRTYFDASVQYLVPGTAKARVQVYGKVSNLFDKDPPITGPTGPNVPPTNQSLYDVVGRAFTLGVRFEY